MPRILFRSWPLLTSITLHGVMAVVLSGMGISIPQPPPRPRQSAPVPTIRWEPRPSIQTPQPVTIQMPVETTESVSETAVEPTALELVFEPLSEPLPELIEVRPPLLAAAEATLQDVEDVETAALQKPPVEVLPQIHVEVFEPATVALEWQPIYPKTCRRKGQQGEVLLIVQVSATGEVLSVEVQQSSGYRLLDRAAIKSVEKLQFIPATRDGIPVSSTLELPLLYQLKP